MTMSRLVSERRNLNDPQIPITDVALVEWLNSGSGFSVDSGITVTPKGSLAMSAVWRAVTVVSGVAAALPLKTYVENSDGSRSMAPSYVGLAISDPHPELTQFDWRRVTFTHRYLWGNFYGFKERNGAGQVRYVYPLNPDGMKVGCFKWARNEVNPTGKVFQYTDDDGHVQFLTPAEVLHLPGFGYDGVTGVSPIRMARQAIGLGLAAERAGARLFGSGAMLSGILQTEQRLNKEQSDAIKAGWRAKVGGNSNPGDIAVVDSGAKFQSLTMPYKDAQFLESRSFQVSEIERFLGLPPFMMMDTEKSTSWGTGLEQQATGWVKFDLGPNWLTPTEQRLTKELLAVDNAYAEHTVDGLLRGDSAARSAFYRIMREVGAYSANDIRRLENLNPIDGGDTYLRPANLTPMSANADTSATDITSDPIEAAKRLAEVVQKVYLGVGNTVSREEARQLLEQAGFPISASGLTDLITDPTQGATP